METWIRKACRQRAYRQLWAWAIITLVVFSGYASASVYWKNFFTGPFAETSEDLAAFTSPDSSPKQFVSVTGSKVVPTDVQVITTETRNNVKERSYVSSAYYLLLMSDGKLLAVESKTEPPLRVEGVFKEVSTDLLNRIFSAPEDRNLRGRMYPVYLSTTDDYRVPGYIAIGGLIVYLIVLGYFARKAWHYAQDISLHPAVQNVEAFPNAAEMALTSERELQTGIRYKKAGIAITDNFIVQRGFLTFKIFPWHNLIWAYKKVTTRTVYYVIPIARTSEAIFVFYGGAITLPSRKKLVDEVLVFAANRSPWAVLGFNDDLQKAFKKDPNGFCAFVEERRAQLRS